MLKSSETGRERQLQECDVVSMVGGERGGGENAQAMEEREREMRRKQRPSLELFFVLQLLVRTPEEVVSVSVLFIVVEAVQEERRDSSVEPSDLEEVSLFVEVACVRRVGQRG